MPLLFCDLDNTLVDRDAAAHRWASSLAAAHGRGDDFTRWLIQLDEGGARPRGDLFSRAAAELGLSGDGEALVGAFMEDFLCCFSCEPEVRAALGRARRAGWTIAVVTNGAPTQAAKLDAASLTPHVDVVCISDVEGVRKPDPALLRIAARKCGRQMEDSWMIGDDPDADIGAAAAAGIRSVWLRRSRQWTNPAFAPTTEADSFSEAVAIALSQGSPPERRQR